MSELTQWGARARALAIAVVLVILLAAGTALLVLLAFGIGTLLSLLLPLSPFEASLLSILAMLGLIAACWRFLERLSPSRVPFEWYEEDEDDRGGEDEGQPFEAPDGYEVVQSAVGGVARNARCPCGSGKKFKRCCGRVTRVARPSE